MKTKKASRFYWLHATVGWYLSYVTYNLFINNQQNKQRVNKVCRMVLKKIESVRLLYMEVGRWKGITNRILCMSKTKVAFGCWNVNEIVKETGLREKTTSFYRINSVQCVIRLRRDSIPWGRKQTLNNETCYPQ